MNKPFNKSKIYYAIEKIAGFVFPIFFISFMLMPFTFETSADEYAHNLHIEELNNQLLETKNKEESAAINVLIKMENNKWEKTQASSAYHFRCLFKYYCQRLFIISYMVLFLCAVAFLIAKAYYKTRDAACPD